jgi:hypothetical protein
MTKYVEWDEPFDVEAIYNLICRMSVEDAIAWQVAYVADKSPAFEYKSDQEALDDFVTVRYARIVEEG